eukprot:1143485-Prorocentrum_lima.AAC.1
MRQRAREAEKGKRSWLMIVLDASAAFDEVRRERIDEEIDKEEDLARPENGYGTKEMGLP